MQYLVYRRCEKFVISEGTFDRNNVSNLYLLLHGDDDTSKQVEGLNVTVCLIEGKEF